MGSGMSLSAVEFQLPPRVKDSLSFAAATVLVFRNVLDLTCGEVVLALCGSVGGYVCGGQRPFS